MKSVAVPIALLLLLAGAPLLAQTPDMQITAWASRVEMQGDNDLGDGFETDFDEGTAFGVSANRFVTSMISVEGAAFIIRNEAGLLLDGVAPIDLGKVNLVPVTLGAQLHLPRRSRIDPYIGAGAAYVMADDLLSPDLEAGGVGRIELENKVTYYLNAGVAVMIGSGFGIVLDGRYIPYESTTRSTVTGVEQELDFSPRLLSLGLRLRF